MVHDTHTHTLLNYFIMGAKRRRQLKTEAKEMLEKGRVSVCSMASDARKSRLQPDSKKSVFPSNPVAKVQGSSLILGDFNM